VASRSLLLLVRILPQSKLDVVVGAEVEFRVGEAMMPRRDAVNFVKERGR
jgi:hypothetical protein